MKQTKFNRELQTLASQPDRSKGLAAVLRWAGNRSGDMTVLVEMDSILLPVEYAKRHMPGVWELFLGAVTIHQADAASRSLEKALAAAALAEELPPRSCVLCTADSKCERHK